MGVGFCYASQVRCLLHFDYLISYNTNQICSWLMGYTAYLNIGKEEHDYFRNGLCINSGGSGDGQWHRSGFGSDDYMYNLAMKHAKS